MSKLIHYSTKENDNSDSPITNEDIDAVMPTIIGDYVTKDKYIEFIGGSNSINFLSREAIIDGSQLSGLDYDGIKFKLTICDEGTVKFDECDTTQTTYSQRARLLEIISEKTIMSYRKRMCIRELRFTSVNKINGESIPLFLVVDYKRPIDILASIFDDDESDCDQVYEISSEQSSKLDSLMSLFDDEESAGSSNIEDDMPHRIIIDNDYKSSMGESFQKMKEDKIIELRERIKSKEIELTKFEKDIINFQTKIEMGNQELSLLQSRLEGLGFIEPFTGYYFNVSEIQNEKIILDEDTEKLIRNVVMKIKSISVERFMKLFEMGNYEIRLGKLDENSKIIEVTDYDNLPTNITETFAKIGISLSIENKLVYRGDLAWGDIVNKMVKFGFGQESEFDKMCNSNSYRITGSEEN